ncbi:predicted protein [Sclerotinia sclerotiorum 1980 UF-70]|uniref:Uncharacterized protein n=1 Tax=Sclerotinia sclerotiorum (strain ATCC 18683 / 1980 / Ss-1) TaxID=665079 RepID=A7FA65_SCLS1|nr:predicted protein [Sclerotinia sclerotiorum 1980 UF-70]EDO00626.1 predicted protein [Sclerotinia sclerotiorum 1980 UF-70]
MAMVTMIMGMRMGRLETGVSTGNLLVDKCEALAHKMFEIVLLIDERHCSVFFIKKRRRRYLYAHRLSKCRGRSEGVVRMAKLDWTGGISLDVKDVWAICMSRGLDVKNDFGQSNVFFCLNFHAPELFQTSAILKVSCHHGHKSLSIFILKVH